MENRCWCERAVGPARELRHNKAECGGGGVVLKEDDWCVLESSGSGLVGVSAQCLLECDCERRRLLLGREIKWGQRRGSKRWLRASWKRRWGDCVCWVRDLLLGSGRLCASCCEDMESVCELLLNRRAAACNLLLGSRG